MKNLDKDEKLIHDELSQIKVDRGNINKNVIEGIREKTRLKRKPLIVSTVSIALFLFLIIGTSAAVIKNSDWFLNKFNPIYKEIVEPLDIKVEDEGIVVEAIAGKKYKNNAIVYISVKDITGKKRLTKNTQFKNSIYFNLKGKEGSYSINEKQIKFDEETNTIYYELNISTDKNTKLSDPLLIGIEKIYLDSKKYKDENINLQLEDMINKEYFYLEESEIFASNNSVIDKEKVLKTGWHSSMIHQDKNQWISNIGIIDSKLHIQIGSKFNKKFGPSAPFLVLKDMEGNEINYDKKIIFITDKNGSVLKTNKISPRTSEYKYHELIFPLNGHELEDYNLYYTGYIDDGIDGKWEIKTNLKYNSNDIKLIDKEFQVDEYLVQKINLNPLVVELNGMYENYPSEEINVFLDTTSGLIELNLFEKIIEKKESTFTLSYISDEPILVDNIKSININEKKIDLNK